MSISSILASVLGIGKILWTFIAPLLAKHTAAILTALLPIAIEAVQGRYDSDADADAKRRGAADYVRTVATAEGIKFSESLLNLAVELALQKLKAEEAKKPTVD